MGRLTRGWFSAGYSLGMHSSKRNHSTLAAGRRLRFEPLEERTLLAAFSVTNANSEGAGSLRQAVLDANAAPGADSITFVPVLAGATINTVNLLITDDVDIQGPVNGPVILSGPALIFRDFTGNGRILDIAAGANVSISRLSFMNGDAATSPDVNPTGEAFGGAIRNAGTLTVRQSLFYHNGAGEPNGGIGAGGGGAIYNSGSLTVIASSFAANFADWGSGGAIYNAGTASVTNSTFIDNYIGLFGGAIYNAAGRTMTVTNCTILKCGGDPNAGVLGLPIGNHGIANLGTMALNNTIVANTPVGNDVVNLSIVTGSHNLIKDGSGGVPGTITGDPMLAAPIYTQANSSYPALALLPRPGQYGSPFSFSPLPDSPAIDAGNNSTVSSFVDQRGAPRINNGVVDIGAFEVPVAPVTLVVTTLTDENNGSIDPALGAGTSLREALSLMLPEDVTITFAPGLAGTIALDASLGSLSIVGSHVTDVSDRGDVTIVGPGAGVITLDGLNQTRILVIEPPSLTRVYFGSVSISGLTFARGNANSSSEGGGAIYNGGGFNLTVSDCAFIDNRATSYGGAIDHDAHKLIVNNCTFVGNSAGQGGALANEHEMTVTDSTFVGNSAIRGGAIWAQYYDIHVPDFPFIRPTVTSSTFSENSATEYGGAIFIASNKGFGRPADLSVINSTISDNSAGVNGGGIYVAGDLTLYGSTVYGNSAASVGPTVAGGIAIADLISGGENYVELVTLVNNIVAGSTSGADLTVFVELGGIVTGSHNLIGDGSGGLPNTITGNPLLGPLADNGGPTKTHALLPGSPAIDAGDPTFDPNAATPPMVNDQRGSGFARIIGNAIDIGAFELQTAQPAGDYNRNGMVDTADYVLWRKTLSTTGVTRYSGADGDGDGMIGQGDYGVWRAQFGQTLPAAGAGSLVQVAETLRDSVAPVTAVSERPPHVGADPAALAEAVAPSGGMDGETEIDGETGRGGDGESVSVVERRADDAYPLAADDARSHVLARGAAAQPTDAARQYPFAAHRRPLATDAAHRRVFARQDAAAMLWDDALVAWMRTLGGGDRVPKSGGAALLFDDEAADVRDQLLCEAVDAAFERVFVEL